MEAKLRPTVTSMSTQRCQSPQDVRRNEVTNDRNVNRTQDYAKTSRTKGARKQLMAARKCCDRELPVVFAWYKYLVCLYKCSLRAELATCKALQSTCLAKMQYTALLHVAKGTTCPGKAHLGCKTFLGYSGAAVLYPPHPPPRVFELCRVRKMASKEGRHSRRLFHKNSSDACFVCALSPILRATIADSRAADHMCGGLFCMPSVVERLLIGIRTWSVSSWTRRMLWIVYV